MASADHRRRLALGLGLAAGLGPLSGCAQPAATPPGPGLTASVTYLHLLAKVPMFRALSREQLQWVIDHSKEWVAAPGTEIASSTRGGDSFWALLDGGWQIEQGGRDMLALGGQTRVVATERSYVLQIQQADLDEMLQVGFPFEPHLQQGLAFYRTLSAR